VWTEIDGYLQRNDMRAAAALLIASLGKGIERESNRNEEYRAGIIGSCDYSPIPT
jgi:hypothetical protein